MNELAKMRPVLKTQESRVKIDHRGDREFHPPHKLKIYSVMPSQRLLWNYFRMAYPAKSSKKLSSCCCVIISRSHCVQLQYRCLDGA